MTTPSGEPAAADLTRQIQEFAPTIHKLAADLNERIEKFAEWISALPGRVETEWSVDSGENEHLMLKFHREGKRWIISHAFYHENFSDPSEEPKWQPLTEASLNVKLQAIDSFADVLKHMRESQIRLHDRLKQAHAKMDSLAAQLEAIRKGGA